MKARTNYRDIAAAAKVCVATVSLALRGHPSIPEATRERIRGVAERLDYRPNARVSELMGEIRRNRAVVRVSDTVALLWSDAARDEVHGYSHLAEFEQAARQSLERHGFGLDVFYKDDTRVERVLRARGIRGLILAPLIRLPHRHLNWDWSRFSVVIAGSGLWRPEFHRVRFNHFEEMALILHHLRHHGKGRIALISDRQVDQRSQRAVVGGFLAHAGERTACSVFESNGRDRVELLSWLDESSPDFVIIGCAQAVPWVLESKAQAKIVLTSQHLIPVWKQFSGIRQDYARLADTAAGQLIGQLTLHQSGPPADPIKVFITGKWDEAH